MDLFDEILLFEEKAIQAGISEGVEAKKKKEFEDGRLKGSENGYDVGRELGRIYGVCLAWESWLCNPSNPKNHKEKILKTIRKLKILLEEITLDTSNEEEQNVLKEKLLNIRSGYKRLASLLGDPFSQDRNSHEDFSF